MAIDGIIFTGVDPLVFIYMYRSSHFHHAVIAPVMTDLSPKRLIMLQIATFFALLVPSQNVKVDWPRYLLLVSSSAELASMLLLSVVGLPCACLLRSFSILFYSKCGVCAFSSHSLYVSTVGL
jgi:hypothetical protein